MNEKCNETKNVNKKELTVQPLRQSPRIKARNSKIKNSCQNNENEAKKTKPLRESAGNKAKNSKTNCWKSEESENIKNEVKETKPLQQSASLKTKKIKTKGNCQKNEQDENFKDEVKETKCLRYSARIKARNNEIKDNCQKREQSENFKHEVKETKSLRYSASLKTKNIKTKNIKTKDNCQKNKQGENSKSKVKVTKSLLKQAVEQPLEAIKIKNKNIPTIEAKGVEKTKENSLTVSKINKSVKHKTSKMNNQLSKEQKESLDKYGILIPTFDEIIEDYRKIEHEQKILECCKTITKNLQEIPDLKNYTIPTENRKLDCKKLTIDELTEMFNKHSEYLYSIFNEKIISERHDFFYNKKKITSMFQELTYTPSCYVFNYDQKKHLIKHLQILINDENGLCNNYLFQVLLPELCLKIFMDVHCMNLDEAINYLENMPID